MTVRTRGVRGFGACPPRPTCSTGTRLAETQPFDWAVGLSVVATGTKPPEGRDPRRLDTAGQALLPVEGVAGAASCYDEIDD